MTAVSRPTGREHLADDIQQTAVQARRRLATAGEATARVAGSTKERLAEASRRPAVRRSLPAAAIAAAAAVGTAIVLVVRRRAAARRTPSRPTWLRRSH